ADGRGVIHRDIKPSNILLDAQGEPVVLDFGLARPVQIAPDKHTRPGLIMGTPAYMPPEQALGNQAAIGPRSDLYSLGVVLYEILTGRAPFQGTSTAILVQVVRDSPPPPASLRPGLDPRLESICLKALHKEPAGRFACMDEFAQALGDFLRDEATPPPAQGPEGLAAQTG